MAAFMHVSDNEDIRLKCDTHNNDLLPLFCRDCNCHLCADCVTLDHAGHNIRNVSEVVEFHKQELREILCRDTSSQFLAKRLSHLQEQQKSLAVHTESLLRNVLDREDEIMERVKIWRQDIFDKIISFRETCEANLRDDQIIISALLQHHEKSPQSEPGRTELELSYLCFRGKHLLTSERCMTSDKDISDLYSFNIGPSGEDLYDTFGIFRYGSEEELSSDSVSINSSKEEEKEEFCDCEDIQGKYQVCDKSIENIVPMDSLKFFVHSLSNVYLCSFHGSKIDTKLTLSNVWRIALIPSTGDILSITSNQKQIKRISFESTITTFLVTGDLYDDVNSGGDQAYACVMYKSDINKARMGSCFVCIHLLNEFGVILKTFERGLGFVSWRLLKTNEENKFYLSTKNRTQIFDGVLGKCTAVYSGAVGKDPGLRFHTCDMITDSNNNVLLAVQNDNAIHLLNKALKFQKLLLTEEDGLRLPSSLALDNFGYLWVGCEDGQIHVVNYQYLLMTDRLARLKYRSAKEHIS
ncbi:uncharacterized protein LOC133204639 [Saccostrea echinata]|uniref:uncharacterized protein LOC133204639 n=1 Tax=Saccostrea echinata TaxID=191078 RepID=UPI002A82DC46|nr:uncharacterized protein LOC133204639 [Saccostrea echinata]